MKRENRYYITSGYLGSDGRDFQTDFVEYLKEHVEKLDNTVSMNEGQLSINGAKKALEELIEELS